MKKKKDNITWTELARRAFECKVESEKFLDMAVRQLMRDKGFSKKVVNCFSSCYAGGDEIVINFCGELAFVDLDIILASDMTKEDIINTFSLYLSQHSLNKLNSQS